MRLLPRTGSSTDDFSLAILRQMENLGVEVINFSQAIEAVKDNRPIPRTMLVRFPCVVKVLVGSYGEGLVLSRDAGSFKANISRGGAGQAYPLKPEIEQLALSCAAALKLEIAGVDLLFDDAQDCVCKVNSAAADPAAAPDPRAEPALNGAQAC